MEIEELYQEYIESDGVSIDTRSLKINQIFFALPGENIDGNTFALQALEKGARKAIVSDPNLSKINDNCLFFTDTLLALQRLASFHRSKLNIPIIGITGSVAKTTTKELIAAVLQSKYKIYYTQGNLNNHIGVPITILNIKKDVEIGIIEMGANHIGEIQKLCEITLPTHGLITRIGKAHLEGFGSLEGVILAKSDLYRFIRDHVGVAFINDADPILNALQQGFDMDKIFIHKLVDTTVDQANPYLHLNVKIGTESIKVNTQIPGLYNIENIEAAIAVGLYFNVGTTEIKASIENYKPKANRSELIIRGSNEFILDAYNANPTSMIEAIRSFIAYKTEKHKMLVIGEMKEMGASRSQVHQEVLDYLHKIEKELKIVCLVGTTFNELNKNKAWHVFLNIKDTKIWYDSQSINNTVVLLKGSRSMTMEKLIDQIKSDSEHV